MTDRIRSLLRRVASATRSLDPNDQKLRECLPSTGSVASMEREIASEIAYSLGKVGGKLELAILSARATLAALEALPAGAVERQRLVARYEDERALAETHLRHLLIQREALGFRRHAEVHRTYVIPPRLPSE
jgi:MoxR-like ATPase